MKFQRDIVNALASYKLRDTDVSPASYDAIEKLPLTLFVKGTSQTRDDLLSHLQVESLQFISKNQLVEMFFPRTTKEFDHNGNCCKKISGLIGTAVENASIVSMVATEVLSDFLTFWSDGNIMTHFKKGNTIPGDKFRKEASPAEDDPDCAKPWFPTVHPASIVRIPVCIPKLKGHTIVTGHVSKLAVRDSLASYSRSAVDWFDSATSHKNVTKFASYKDFGMVYQPADATSIKEKSFLHPVFELDYDSMAHQTMSRILTDLKAKCLQSLPSLQAQNNSTAHVDNYSTPKKNSFMSPKSPKSMTGDESVLSETVREKVKYSVFFYRLLLASKYTDTVSGCTEISLGNLSEQFLTSLNSSGRSEGQRIFTNTFNTYIKERLQSDSYLDTSIHFPHINRTMVSLLLTGDFRSSPLDEEIEYLSQSISVLSFLPPPRMGENADYKLYVQKSKDTNMEDVVEERPEKCSAYDKKLFTKGRQESFQDAITTIANLVIYLEFISNETQCSETPAVIVLLKGLGKMLATPTTACRQRWLPPSWTLG